MTAGKIKSEDRFTSAEGPVFLSGNQTFVRLLFEQHRRDREAGLRTGGFVSGYRGSPFGTFDKDLAGCKSLLDERDIVVNKGVNEATAATSVWGSQQVDFFRPGGYDGVFGLWYGKGPGVSHAADALHHANLWGTQRNGGVVMAVGDDPMARSSSIQQQSEFQLSSFCIPVLHCANVQDILDYGLLGYGLSRYAGVWVAVKVVSDIAESWYMVDVNPDRSRIVIPDDHEIPPSGVHTRWPDTSVQQDERMATTRLPAVHAFVRANDINRVAIDSDRKRFGIVTAGKSYLDTLEALGDLGVDSDECQDIGLSIFKVGMIWPLERESLRNFADGIDEILVLEEGRPFLETQVKEALYDLPEARRPKIVGKLEAPRNTVLPTHGELTPGKISRVLFNWLEPAHSTESMRGWIDELDRTQAQLDRLPDYIQRTPYFCSGCPHSTSTNVPEGSNQLIGIGCHYLVQLMDRGGITYTQMGGEGATWAGAAPFVADEHMFVNLGDGTYYHSGYLAIRQAITSGANITYKILFNDAVAMTGGQSVDGPISVAAITRQLHAEGVKRIAVVSREPDKLDRAELVPGSTVSDRDDLMSVMKELRAIPGVTALIYDQTCATELRRRRKRGLAEDPAKRVFINHRVCEGCGDCGVRSNCLSVQPLETELGRKRTIDQSACNKDYSCVAGFCPSFVTVHGGGVRRPQAVSDDRIDIDGLPEPAVIDDDSVYNVLVCGIGGTGVVTISSVLSEAARAEGKVSQVLDLTGMAQKFGAVHCHLKIGTSKDQLRATRIARGKANLLLGADIVTVSSAEGMSRLRKNHTRGVVNEHETVTGAFTRDTEFHIPVEAMKSSIEAATGSGQVRFADVTELSRALTGNTIGANVMMLGIACQAGLLPVSRQSIEAAIKANDVAVDYNLRAFALGRLWAHDRSAMESLLPTPGDSGGEFVAGIEDLDARIDARYEDLVQYQDRAYAERYRGLLDKVREAETSRAAGRSGLADAVARNFYKLMAYKDEYEIARLYTSGDWLESVKAQFQDYRQIRFHMAPPLISRRNRETGELEKREFGFWLYRVLKIVAKLRSLRGTSFDVFGYSDERREERRLIEEYEATIGELCSALDHENHELAVQIASIPDLIRGFGHVKDKNLKSAAADRKRLLETFRSVRSANIAA